MDAEASDVEAILIVAGVDTHIAVLVVWRMVRIFGIFAPHVHDAGTRSRHAEFIELSEKRLSFVERSACCQLVPIVGPPDGLIVDGAWFFRRVDRDHILPRLVAWTTIKYSLIAIYQPALLPALLAERWGREWGFLSSNHR